MKRGKPHGAWREFFDDGTVREVRFFKSSKLTGDYWPSGQLKRKEARRGNHKIIEWYHPSGALQKRLVFDPRSSQHVEPARVFHENGQLAEECAVVGGNKHGRWRKYFDDGALQLDAEFSETGHFVIHQAWNDERRQVVKNGTGVFEDDGRRINSPSQLFSTSRWRHVVQLKGGKPGEAIRTTPAASSP